MQCTLVVYFTCVHCADRPNAKTIMRCTSSIICVNFVVKNERANTRFSLCYTNSTTSADTCISPTINIDQQHRSTTATGMNTMQQYQ
eukprot:m.98321 g.98321  ORF g.98321 m.98321 type:complete len:87 (-) comp27051_c1_seq1:48-308(-)